MNVHRRAGWGCVWLLVLLALPGCPRREPPPAPIVADEERIEWASTEPWFIVVRTQCRTLDVYYYGDRYRSYPAVFGLGGKKGKLHEGDRRTPTGLYAIVGVRRHPRWRRFLLLDYPNLRDVQRYQTAMEAGDIPMLGSLTAGVGGAVGIHGTDKPSLNRKGVDWTHGCISLSNDDVEELSRIVPIGTQVLIED